MQASYSSLSPHSAEFNSTWARFGVKESKCRTSWRQDWVTCKRINESCFWTSGKCRSNLSVSKTMWSSYCWLCRPRSSNKICMLVWARDRCQTMICTQIGTCTTKFCSKSFTMQSNTTGKMALSVSQFSSWKRNGTWPLLNRKTSPRLKMIVDQRKISLVKKSARLSLLSKTQAWVSMQILIRICPHTTITGWREEAHKMDCMRIRVKALAL